MLLTESNQYIGFSYDFVWYGLKLMPKPFLFMVTRFLEVAMLIRADADVSSQNFF